MAKHPRAGRACGRATRACCGDVAFVCALTITLSCVAWLQPGASAMDHSGMSCMGGEMSCMDGGQQPGFGEQVPRYADDAPMSYMDGGDAGQQFGTAYSAHSPMSYMDGSREWTGRGALHAGTHGSGTEDVRGFDDGDRTRGLQMSYMDGTAWEATHGPDVAGVANSAHARVPHYVTDPPMTYSDAASLAAAGVDSFNPVPGDVFNSRSRTYWDDVLSDARNSNNMWRQPDPIRWAAERGGMSLPVGGDPSRGTVTYDTPYGPVMQPFDELNRHHPIGRGALDTRHHSAEMRRHGDALVRAGAKTALQTATLAIAPEAALAWAVYDAGSKLQSLGHAGQHLYKAVRYKDTQQLRRAGENAVEATQYGSVYHAGMYANHAYDRHVKRNANKVGSYFAVDPHLVHELNYYQRRLAWDKMHTHDKRNAAAGK